MNENNTILQPSAEAVGDAGRLHGLPPVVAANTRLLILGSFPGVRSLAERRYYAHPQNQFWRLLQANLARPGDEDLLAMADERSAGPLQAKLAPRCETRRCSYAYEQRLAQMLRWGVGLWDVYASCQRQGSLDTAIRDAECNDFHALARRLPDLQAVAFNGGESWKHHRQLAELGLPLVRLPSSSPANASWSFARKRAAWREVFEQAGLAVRDLPPPG